MTANLPSLGPEPAASPLSTHRLDEAAVAKLRELDPEGRHGVLVRVMAAYEASLERLLAQLASAQDRGDQGAIASIAHTLKSSSASVGALALSECCAQTERSVRSGDTATLASQVAEMLEEGGRVLGSVRAMLRP